MERRLIRMMCGVRLLDRVSTNVLCDRVGVLKIEDMITQKPSLVVWSCHAWRHQFPNTGGYRS